MKFGTRRYLWGCVAAVVAGCGAGTMSARAAGDAVAAVVDPAILVEAEHLVTAILSEQPDAAYGEYLAGECLTCHQRSGASGGIPPIAGLPIDYTVQAMVEYRLGIRSNDVMQLMTMRLANEEIAALAAFFAGLEAD